MEGSITLSIDKHIAVITFSHPVHNSMPGYLLSDLAAHIKKAGENPDVHVIVLSSGGDRTFCAGASFDELITITNSEDGKKFFLGFAHVINAMRKCPKIIICRVHGKAIGGGVGIAAAADYCMATNYGTIKLSELALGIGPFVIGPAVERKIGLSAFSQLALNATEWQTAVWAKEKGLYHEVFDSIEQLDAYVDELSQRLAATSSSALLALKQALWHDTQHWDQLLEERAGISGRLVITEASQKAIRESKIV
ncbi:MAG: enoyl-CoA hydratase/isomerase family protein [Saprospiraceae bacterium]|nr:enoyl-CoA hydratase/isomerase family protein [Candidatus Opimibacter skivensis]